MVKPHEELYRGLTESDIEDEERLFRQHDTTAGMVFRGLKRLEDALDHILDDGERTAARLKNLSARFF